MTLATQVTGSTPFQSSRKTDLMTRFWRWEASGILVALIVLCAFLSLATSNFLSPYNAAVVSRQAAFVGLVALGQTLVLLVGGIDLSVGAAAGLSAIVGALMITAGGVHPYLVIPLTMLFGLALGLINGVFVAGLRLNPFIVTLATWEIFAGMNLVIKYKALADVNDTRTSFANNMELIKAFAQRYPEYRTAFAGYVARAVDPSTGADYGTVLNMNDVK